MTDQTLLLRQVHPKFLPEGELSSQAFMPFPKDDGKLSVDNGDLVTPQASYQHYTVKLGLESIGVWAVNGAEVESVGLLYRSDPVPTNQAHAVIDFGTLAEKVCRKLAKKLKKFAACRDSLHRAV